MRPQPLTIALVIAVTASLLGSCSSTTSSAAPAPAPLAAPALGAAKPVNYPGVPNVVAYHDGFYSGGVPDGDEGFDTLAALGVKTIISVDGAEPDLAKARARGMRYVHLPIGYNGFDDARKLELTRAVRDLGPDGPIYIHCHHGKHRSAGAAGTIAVSLGWIDNAEAERLMKVSGTAPNYRGLYQCTADAVALSTAQLDAAPGDFPEVSRPNGFVKSMLAIDDATEHLKAIEKAGWKVPATHPDLVPVAEAGRAADLLRVLCAGERAKANGSDFTTGLRQASDHAQELEDMLARDEPDATKLSAQFALVNASCRDCHAHHRD